MRWRSSNLLLALIFLDAGPTRLKHRVTAIPAKSFRLLAALALFVASPAFAQQPDPWVQRVTGWLIRGDTVARPIRLGLTRLPPVEAGSFELPALETQLFAVGERRKPPRRAALRA
jgi:hypothetical protein